MSKPSRAGFRTTNWSSYTASLPKRASLLICLDKEMTWLAPPDGRAGDHSRAPCSPDLLTRLEALMPITPRDIEDQFEDAALTLCRLPNPPGSGAKGYGHSWPEYIHDARQAYGTDEVRMRVAPSARDIQRMEDCISWMAWLDPKDARIVWLRAEEEAQAREIDFDRFFAELLTALCIDPNGTLPAW